MSSLYIKSLTSFDGYKAGDILYTGRPEDYDQNDHYFKWMIKNPHLISFNTGYVLITLVKSPWSHGQEVQVRINNGHIMDFPTEYFIKKQTRIMPSNFILPISKFGSMARR